MAHFSHLQHLQNLKMAEVITGHEGSNYPNAYPLINPLDAFRIVIADEVARIANVPKELVFDGLGRTATLDTGDLLLAVPRLRVKTIPPNDLAIKIASEVISVFYFPGRH